MKGYRISEKTFDLVKGMLSQGYSIKKIESMLPEEIKICANSIRKIDGSGTYAEYLGEKKEEPKPEKVVQITPYSQTKEVVEEIAKTNVLLESIFQMLKELMDSLT